MVRPCSLVCLPWSPISPYLLRTILSGERIPFGFHDNLLATAIIEMGPKTDSYHRAIWVECDGSSLQISTLICITLRSAKKGRARWHSSWRKLVRQHGLVARARLASICMWLICELPFCQCHLLRSLDMSGKRIPETKAFPACKMGFSSRGLVQRSLWCPF